MSKSMKPTGRTPRDIHAVIRAEAVELKERNRRGVASDSPCPGLDELHQSYFDSVAAAVPPSFVFKGRIYFGRVRLVALVEVFADLHDREPLAFGVKASSQSERHGHTPGH
jgi:hypothetical protein